MKNAETKRLAEDAARTKNWKRWGPYLAERQWGTVREDYSADGNCWEYFSHDHARSRAYRWGEDGLLGVTDRQCRLCFGVALWNERDPFLKERLFGLTGPQGNHGEDVKEEYFYLDATPTHSYLRALYKYPQAEFPYARLLAENRRRTKTEREFELCDAGVFDESRYFDVIAEYAKADADDIVIRLTVANRGPERSRIHLLPTLWFRNTWSWGRTGEGYWSKPSIRAAGPGRVIAEHESLGTMTLLAAGEPPALFTENETNAELLFQAPNRSPYVKDAFHRFVVNGDRSAVSPDGCGTKMAFHYVTEIEPGGERSFDLRLKAGEARPGLVAEKAIGTVITKRRAETDAFYSSRIPAQLGEAEASATRQAYASLLWSKKFFHYVVRDWLEGDPGQPAPPAERLQGRNRDWRHLYNRDVISMPDSWEYPWYAAWDLAFHMLPVAKIDPEFAKEQLVLFTREWFMHPSGQLPAYEFAFGDVNPPVHAWAAWRVYKLTAPRGQRDRLFLSRIFQKMSLNFTWWVNRKDAQGDNLFGGGFLGLDNIGVFDRSRPLPGGGSLEQADGTAWMAFYCIVMLEMALELARDNPACEDMASKYFEHFVSIVDAINGHGGSGLWCPRDGFWYDQLLSEDRVTPLRVRSMVGLMPLIACMVLEDDVLERCPRFARRMQWFLRNRTDLGRHVAVSESGHAHRLLAIPSREQLERTLRYLLDENEFLSPHGIRSLSKIHGAQPYAVEAGGESYEVHYTPAESDTFLFGGNSNWRGPVWFPVNYLLIEALERYHHFYGDELKVECPTGSGRWMSLGEVAGELNRRLATLFVPDATGGRPCHGGDPRFANDPHWRDLVNFSEYFCGETGRGLGARFQGWTTLATRCIEDQVSGGGAIATTTSPGR